MKKFTLALILLLKLLIPLNMFSYEIAIQKMAQKNMPPQMHFITFRKIIVGRLQIGETSRFKYCSPDSKIIDIYQGEEAQPMGDVELCGRLSYDEAKELFYILEKEFDNCNNEPKICEDKNFIYTTKIVGN